MKTLYLLLLFIFLPGSIICQISPFQRSYGGINNDVGNSVVSLNENGYLIFGTTSNFNSNNTDLILLRIDSHGNIIWANRYGGNLSETAEHIELTSDGGYILLANTTSFGAGNSDLLVIKTNANGEVDWSRTFGGPRNDFSACIKPIPTGDYIIAGRTQSFGSGGEDAYLIRINDQGNLIWSRAYGTVNNERFYYVDNMSNEDFIITGIENSSTTLNYDVLVSRIDRNGRLLSNTSFGDKGGSNDDASDCIRATSDGGYAFSGHYQSYGSGGLDLALTKVNSRGTIQWTRVFGNAGNERAWDFQIDESNNYLIAGYTSSYGNGGNEALAIRINQNGNPVWTRTYGGRSNEEFYECIINNDSIAFVGYTASIGAGASDIYIIKTDFDGTSPDECRRETNSIRNSFVSPQTRSVLQNTTNLNQQTISSTVELINIPLVIDNISATNTCLQPTPVTLIDFSLSKKNGISFLNWTTSSEINTKLFIVEQSLDGLIFDSTASMLAINKGNRITNYEYMLPMLNNEKSYYRLKIIDYDGYTDYTKIIYSNNEDQSIIVYPTCFKNNIIVKNIISKNNTIMIYITDMNGRELYKNMDIDEQDITINTEDWPSGVFIVRIISTNGKEYFTKKIVKN